MMPFLTAAVLAAFVGYAGAWYFELLEGNFALLLFMATVVTGLYWVAERLWYLPRRRGRNQRRSAIQYSPVTTVARNSNRAKLPSTISKYQAPA